MLHACEDVQAGRHGALEELRGEASALLGELEAHQRLENDELAPFLGELPAFGEQRIEELRQYHAEQRADVTDVVERLRRKPVDATVLAADVMVLIDRLREDLVWEDRELVNPDLLKDDLVDVSLSS